MNGVIAFAFWSSTFLNPDAPILEGLTVREVPGFMQLGVSSDHFQKETIGSELAFYNGENYAGKDIHKIDQIVKGEEIVQEKFFSTLIIFFWMN